jgi:hypothetical protein
MNRWRRLLRAPAVHFLVLGGLLFAADAWRPRRPERAPGPVRSDQDLLLEEALALGLDRTDRFVRERLAGLVRIVDAGAVEDAPGLEREARRLGLERHDLVVRRHLVQAMELALAHGSPREWPDDATLAAYVERHRERFVQPARVRFSHVFFARDRAGEPAAAAAAATLTRLVAGAPEQPAAVTLGDGFLAGSEIAASESEVARTFGPAFAAALVRFPPGAWAGPVASSYGWHLVQVHERVPAAVPPLAAIRSRVVHAVLAEQAAARLERRLAERRARAGGERS